jgi:hypothetical protein
MKSVFSFFFAVICSLTNLSAQNQLMNWWISGTVGISFSTTPPSLFPTVSSPTIQAAGSAISDAQGNLLFYTNGVQVWSANNQLMPNGTGLLGGSQAPQNSVIVKKPGSASQYIILTTDMAAAPSNQGVRYSVVDMALSSPTGSVTVKNIPILPGKSTSGRCMATPHCNNVDYWIVTDDCRGRFYSFLLTAAGINTVPVISPRADTSVRVMGYIKFPLNGKKLAMTVPSPSWTSYPGRVELYDFSTSTGSVSYSPLYLMAGYAFGCEFSPDGSKIYTSCTGDPWQTIQWDLCAGTTAGILSSSICVSTFTGPLNPYGGLQLAIDGKIYGGVSSGSMTVIHNPNGAGLSCNFQKNGFLYSNFLVNNSVFPPGSFKVNSTFTFTNNCQKVDFNGSSVTTSTLNNCSMISYPIANYSWNFGDPSSGTTNTTTALNPTHYYSTPGVFTATMFVNYPCYTDTVRQTFTLTAGPSFSVNGLTTICNKDSRTFAVSNPALTYNWSTGSTSQSITISPTVTTSYSVVGTDSNTACSFQKIVTVTVNKCNGLSENSAQNNINIHPNPASGLFQIHGDAAIGPLVVLNQLGEIVLRENISAQDYKLDLSRFADGLYYLRTEAGSYSVVKMGN